MNLWTFRIQTMAVEGLVFTPMREAGGAQRFPTDLIHDRRRLVATSTVLRSL
jgi:hypothetical protein